MKKTMGLLGGIGPESSAKFYLNLIREVQRRKLVKTNIDYPHVVLNSIPAPELVDHDDLSVYLSGVKTLERAGVDFIAIVCNTAYIHIAELQAAVKVPIIHLMALVNSVVNRESAKKILVLGSRKLVDSGLFSFGHIEASSEDKDKIDDIILKHNIDASPSKNKAEVMKLIGRYNPDLVVIACTELSSFLIDLKIKKIDTLDILLDEVIRCSVA
ncbi:MAG: aspartate/glutamate racemase family protein [Nanoarchaeota archaeon]|nr:aspartate/glutamate racemase family protein [Nanoarchaeota archaeon]MBU0976812.1 aspartate/glutamate racemase family protein [Nanoarchaeota archaeon]